jgi:hypothetical protein
MTIAESLECLYFIAAKGCEACESTIPEVDRFIAKHPRTMVIRLDASGPVPASLGIKVKLTPTFAFRRGTEIVTWVGMTKEKEIESRLKKMGAQL